MPRTKNSKTANSKNILNRHISKDLGGKTKKKKGKPEWYVQKDIVDWFRKEYPDFILFSVPNEAIYRRREYFHAIGALSGVSDLVIVTDKRTLWIECKSDTGRQSKEQRQFQANVERLGYKYYIVRSLDQFKGIIEIEFS